MFDQLFAEKLSELVAEILCEISGFDFLPSPVRQKAGYTVGAFTHQHGIYIFMVESGYGGVYTGRNQGGAFLQIFDSERYFTPEKAFLGLIRKMEKTNGWSINTN